METSQRKNHHNCCDGSVSSVNFEADPDVQKLDIAMDMSHEEVRKSIVTDIDSFLSNEWIGHDVVLENCEKMKRLHVDMMAELSRIHHGELEFANNEGS